MTGPTNLDHWRGRRVFVTGHTGLKGAWLCLLLNRLGAEVAGYALAPPTQPSLYELLDGDRIVKSTVADIRDLDTLSAAIRDFEPQVILHLAAQSVVLESYRDPVETYTSNVIGTLNVLEAVRRTGRRVAIVNVTTDKVYENRGWVWGYRECDALGGHDPYSNSKACAEFVAQAYRASFFPAERVEEHGVAIGCARAGNVIAGGDWTPHQLVPEAVKAFAAARSVELRHPGATRPWQHVLDCLLGYLTLAEALSSRPTQSIGDWNFGPGDGRPLTVVNVVELLARQWGLDRAWVASGGTTPPEAHELRLDSSKADRLLGWRSLLTTEEAVEWVGRWYVDVANGATPREVCLRQIDDHLARARAGR